MIPSSVSPYLHNLFWLILPLLAFNLMFVRYLPPAYRMEVFWKDIPAWIGIPENLLRLPVFMLPLILRFELTTSGHRFGLGLYVAGTLCYFAAWETLILYPGSEYSRSAAGFMAPAYTPAFWLAGIGLTGTSCTIPRLAWHPAIYLCVAGFFLLFHMMHTWVVYMRQR